MSTSQGYLLSIYMKNPVEQKMPGLPPGQQDTPAATGSSLGTAWCKAHQRDFCPDGPTDFWMGASGHSIAQDGKSNGAAAWGWEETSAW